MRTDGPDPRSAVIAALTGGFAFCFLVALPPVMEPHSFGVMFLTY